MAKIELWIDEEADEMVIVMHGLEIGRISQISGYKRQKKRAEKVASLNLLKQDLLAALIADDISQFKQRLNDHIAKLTPAQAKQLGFSKAAWIKFYSQKNPSLKSTCLILNALFN